MSVITHTVDYMPHEAVPGHPKLLTFPISDHFPENWAHRLIPARRLGTQLFLCLLLARNMIISYNPVM